MILTLYTKWSINLSILNLQVSSKFNFRNYTLISTPFVHGNYIISHTILSNHFKFEFSYLLDMYKAWMNSP